MSKPNKPSPAPDRCPAQLAPLLSLLLDGQLSADQRDQLQALLRDRADCRRYYLRLLNVHAATQWTLGQARPQQRNAEQQERPVADDDWRTGDVDTFLDMLAQLDDPSNELVPINVTELLAKEKQARRDALKQRHHDRPSAKEIASVLAYLGSRPAVWGPLAALLAFAITIAIVFIASNSPQPAPIATTPNNNKPAESAQPIPRDTEPTSNLIVATLTAQRNAQWAEGALAPGSNLDPGTRLTLTQGFAEITTNRGAIAILEAPATIELTDNDNAIRLHAGKLVGLCHTDSSKGFVVRTPQMDVTDLGTEFGVLVSPESQQSSAFVFSGSVVAEASNSLPIPDQSLELTQGQGAVGSLGQLTRQDHIDTALFADALNLVNPRPVTSGSARLIAAGSVPSLNQDALESDDWVHIIQERAGVRPASGSLAAIVFPGAYDRFDTIGLPIDHRGAVNSYLFHFDSVEASKRTIISGQVTFPTPVVAILATDEQLKLSDNAFAWQGIAMPRIEKGFGIEGVEIETKSALADMIELSEDRKTIRFRLCVYNNSIDEFRVLIESNEP